MNKIAIVVMAGLVAGFIGCASQTTNAIRGTDVEAADKAPTVKPFSEKSPGGTQTLIPRTFAGQPPLVPHIVAKYEPITVAENDCLDCHISDEFNGRKMPRMGDSHFVSLDKNGKGEPVVNMARYQCTTCHVQQADAKPLVENDFVGYQSKP